MVEAPKPLRLKRETIAAPEPARSKELPIASILVDTGLLHLDQELDFLVPADLSDVLVPGVLVKVPFNRKRVLGIVLGRKDVSEYRGELRFISEAIRPFPVVTPHILNLTAEVSKYYGGNRWDVIRYALPTFSGKRRDLGPSINSAGNASVGEKSRDIDHRYSENFWRALRHQPAENNLVRAFWAPPPAENPFLFLRKLINQSSRSALVVMPDHVDVERMYELLSSDPDNSGREIFKWHSELKKGEREEIFLRILHSKAIILLGVRGSLFMPVKNLDLIILWEESNENHSEQRSPYFHGREVAIMKSNIEKSHLVLAGFSPSIRSASYINSKYLTPLTLENPSDASRVISVLGIQQRNSPEERGRISSTAWRVIKSGLNVGPVLIQIPIRGYIQSLSCASCRNQALCTCGGKLVFTQGNAVPICKLCNDIKRSWICPYCHGQRLRQNQIGDLRLTEELGRAFPNQRVIFSNRDHRILMVSNEPIVVVATPGAEPVAESGYGAIVVLNSNLLLERATLDSEVETRNRWFSLGTMLKREREIFVDTDYANRNVQALVRWDPIGVAMKELEERRNLMLPPVVKCIEVIGDSGSVSEAVRNLPGRSLVSHPQLLSSGESVALIRVDTQDSALLINEIFRRMKHQSASGVRIARIKIDPISL